MNNIDELLAKENELKQFVAYHERCTEDMFHRISYIRQITGTSYINEHIYNRLSRFLEHYRGIFGNFYQNLEDILTDLKCLRTSCVYAPPDMMGRDTQTDGKNTPVFIESYDKII